jgi:hypothetical protein
MHIINPIKFDFMIYGQRLYQLVSLGLLARLAPSVASQLDKFCCMFDYNFKNIHYIRYGKKREQNTHQATASKPTLS